MLKARWYKTGRIAAAALGLGLLLASIVWAGWPAAGPRPGDYLPPPTDAQSPVPTAPVSPSSKSPPIEIRMDGVAQEPLRVPANQAAIDNAGAARVRPRLSGIEIGSSETLTPESQWRPRTLTDVDRPTNNVPRLQSSAGDVGQLNISTPNATPPPFPHPPPIRPTRLQQIAESDTGPELLPHATSQGNLAMPAPGQGTLELPAHTDPPGTNPVILLPPDAANDPSAARALQGSNQVPLETNSERWLPHTVNSMSTVPPAISAPSPAVPPPWRDLQPMPKALDRSVELIPLPTKPRFGPQTARMPGSASEGTGGGSAPQMYPVMRPSNRTTNLQDSPLAPRNAAPPDDDVLPQPRRATQPPANDATPPLPRRAAPAPASDDTPPPPRSQDPSADFPDVRRAILLGAARNAIRRGEFDLAITRFEEYLASFPDDYDARAEYAGLLVTVGQPRRALDQYVKVITLRPNDPKLRISLADVYTQLQEFQQAIQQLLLAQQLSPDDLRVITKLARVYTFDNDTCRAWQIYDRYLASLKPGEERVPTVFPALLNDLDRPTEALQFALPLKEKNPEDLELLGEIVRAYTHLGDRAQAFQVVEEMSGIKSTEMGQRLGIADSLYTSGEYELAEMMYQQMLRFEPQNGNAILGTARVAIQQYCLQRAREILSCYRPTSDSLRRSYLLTWAVYHQAVGEYTEAKQIYRDMLRKQETDYEAHLELGRLYEFIHDFEKAKAEYGKIPANTSWGKKARQGFISTLTLQREFEPAIKLGKQLLLENPNDPGAMNVLVRALSKAKHYGVAIAVAQSFLTNNCRTESAVIAARLALGRVFLDAHKYADAVHEYEAVLARPTGRIPVAFYGVARAYAKLGQRDRALHCVQGIAGMTGSDIRNRIQLADLYSGDYEDEAVAEITRSILQSDPDNLAALIRYADALQRLARADGNIEALTNTTKHIKRLSPTNVRAFLTQARGFSIAQLYQQSVAEYEHLLVLDPNFLVPQRERARVLYSEHLYGAASAAYQHAVMPPDEQLRIDMTEIIQCAPQLRHILEPYMSCGIPPQQLRQEIAKLSCDMPDTEMKAAMQRIINDYEARSLEQAGFLQEDAAKSLKGWRDWESIPQYQKLLQMEPANEEGWFDLGQVYSTLKLTHKALNDYSELEEVSPGHREGGIAMERATAELNPKLTYWYDYLKQFGRNGLANIVWMKFHSGFYYPIGDEDEYAAVLFARALYEPPDDSTTRGNIPSLRIQKKYWERLLLFGQINYENYNQKIVDRATYELGFRYYHDDCVQFRYRSFLEYYMQNSETVNQNTRWWGNTVGANFVLSRRWDIDTSYLFAYFSDVNYYNQFDLINYVILCFPPKQVKVVGLFELQTFSNQTIFRFPDNPEIIAGAIHPYFSPNIFAYYGGRLEFTHWLSRDFFAHSNQFYYSLHYSLVFDSNNNSYNIFRALFNYDIYSWLSVGADFSQTLSPVYTASTLGAFLTMRFPFSLCD